MTTGTGSRSPRTNPTNPAPRRSLLQMELDCPWCLAATVEALEADASVLSVQSHASQGCMEVTHTGPVDAVLRIVTTVGRRVEVAGNGEAIMAAATARVVSTCDRHPTPQVTRISDCDCTHESPGSPS